MIARPIRYLGDPVLRKKAKQVKSIDRNIRLLIESMFYSMTKAQGVGLAAPQIGINLAIAVIDIHPEIKKIKGKRIVDNEGCLSVPGYRGNPERCMEITVEAVNEKNKKIKMHAVNNLLAQVLEHEIDHLYGTLYIDKIRDPNSLLKLNGTDWVQDDE
jgi:peptide deformylase